MREDQKTCLARQLRRNETVAEKRLWEQLRNRQLAGFKFLRQAPVGPYIADFLCRERNFIIEVDGETHSTNSEIHRDSIRTCHLEKLGYTLLRIQNDEAVHGIDEVLTVIRDALNRCPSPSPSHGDGSPSSPASGRGQ